MHTMKKSKERIEKKNRIILNYVYKRAEKLNMMMYDMVVGVVVAIVVVYAIDVSYHKYKMVAKQICNKRRTFQS